MYASFVSQDICKSSVHYADRVAARVECMGEQGRTQATGETQFEVTNEVRFYATITAFTQNVTLAIKIMFFPVVCRHQ